MNSSLEERRRRFRQLAETHPGLMVASVLVEDAKANARPKWQAASLGRNGYKKSDTLSECPARNGLTQRQACRLAPALKGTLSLAVDSALATPELHRHD